MALDFDALFGTRDFLGDVGGGPTPGKPPKGSEADSFFFDAPPGEDDAPPTAPHEVERDALLVLLDCQKLMFEPNAEGRVPFEVAVECIELLYKNTVLCSERDHVGLLLYGTREMNNTYEFPNIYSFHDLSPPTATRVKELRQLRAARADFETHVGSCPGAFAMDEGLWAAHNAFLHSAKRFATKRVLIFTGDDNPCKGAAARRDKCFSRARDMAAAGITIELLALRKGLPHQRGSASPPSSARLHRPGGHSTGSSPHDRGSAGPTDPHSLSLRPAGTGFGFLARGVSFSQSPGETPHRRRDTHGTASGTPGGGGAGAGSGSGADPGESFDAEIFWRHLVYGCDPEGLDRKRIGLDAKSNVEDLVQTFRQRAHPKRSQGRLLVQIGGGPWDRPAFAVAVYNPIRRETRRTPVSVEALTNSPVVTQTRFLCAETADVLDYKDMLQTLQVGPERIEFRPEELKDIRTQFGDPGLRILGFKPTSRLKPKYHMGPCGFLQPDDSQVANSGRVYRALWTKMLELRMFAVGELIARQGSPPRLVALVAVKEPAPSAFDEPLPQMCDGLYAVPLPYADDIRPLRLPPPPEVGDADALKRQVDKAKRFMRAMRKPCLDPRDITNPALQKHYSVLQSVALDEDCPKDMEDLTVPDYPYMREKGLNALFGDFAKAVYPDGYSAAALVGGTYGKHKAGDGDSMPPPKAPKVDVAGLDFAALARDGALASLTVPQLRQHLRDEGLARDGAKAQLVKRIEDHYLGVGASGAGAGSG
eukprot:TRINITY_DN56159_c0_g1_i1.p1 TRINITY_DN56159_c0_g1~~TRINITY_DN56159_c0_g1_i1.p1  ORF type:complete len:790 (+),score=279.37 TRINITY_DN56159_c0_g1_i1:83-2371(+)